MDKLQEKARRAEKRRRWWEKERRRHRNYDALCAEACDLKKGGRRSSRCLRAPTGAKPVRIRTALAKLFITPRRQAATFVLASSSF